MELESLGCTPSKGGDDACSDGWPRKQEASEKLIRKLARALGKPESVAVHGVTWGALQPVPGRGRLNDEGVASLARDAEVLGARQERLTLKASTTAAIVSETIDLMGADCVLLLSAWPKLAEYLDENVRVCRFRLSK